jgi:glycosyltransferase involved in cell wall biosynthesis
MKICIFTETYFPVVGGGETQARLLAEGLTDCGHSVMIITRRSDGTLKSRETYGDVQVYRLAPVGSGQLKKWGLLLSSIPMLIRLRNQYDLIFVSGYRIIGLSAVLIAKLFGKRVVLKADSQGEMSGDFFTSGLRKFGASSTSLLFRLFLRFRNFMLKKADAFSAISTEIASEWTLNGIPSNKVHLIPNSVNTARFAPVERGQKLLLREQLKLPRAAVITIYTGRLVSYKGLPLLLKVWNDLCIKQENVLLVLAGTGGLDIHNCENELHEYVRANGLRDHVRFTGAIENIEDYLQASDIFVFPTENDAFPSSVVEAMACALPVISTPVGAIKTIIRHEENGILIEPGNHQQLFDTLDVLIADTKRCSRLGLAGWRTVQEHYSAAGATAEYISLFRATLEHPGAGL